MADAVPWVVAGRYEVGEVVGRGGYGSVHRALDRHTGRSVAMKVLSADAGKDPHVVERMLREQQALVAMSGTCAVSAIDLCRLSSGAPCLVMEWLDGHDLERQLSEWEGEAHRPSSELVLAMVRPLADTLQRAHELGIVHRDIKPANVFLTAGALDASTASQAIRLLDFGLSRMRSAAPLTAVGMVMGSPSYIPPETWRGDSRLIDHRADLYSLAVIVYRMLAGRLPFETPSLMEKLELVTTGERPSVCAFRPDLPLTVDDWMKRALAIEPDQRFQSGSAFYDALARALSGLPLQVADDETSGVHRKISVASLLPVENRGVLSAAWERATSLLQRFIGQRGSSPPPAPTPISTAPTPISTAPEMSGTELPPERPSQQADQSSGAWLDDRDLEDLPPDSTLPAEASAPPLETQHETPARHTAPGGEKKKPRHENKNKNKNKNKGKAKKAKQPKSDPATASAQHASKKGKRSRKKH